MPQRNKKTLVSIIMGSQSDYSTMKYTEDTLNYLKIRFDTKIISAHRTPKRLFEFSKKAEKNKVSIIIAGAGGSAHLPGMVAAITPIPVIAVPSSAIVFNIENIRSCFLKEDGFSIPSLSACFKSSSGFLLFNSCRFIIFGVVLKRIYLLQNKNINVKINNIYIYI